jgi:hypothetical protein
MYVTSALSFLCICSFSPSNSFFIFHLLILIYFKVYYIHTHTKKRCQLIESRWHTKYLRPLNKLPSHQQPPNHPFPLILLPLTNQPLSLNHPLMIPNPRHKLLMRVVCCYVVLSWYGDPSPLSPAHLPLISRSSPSRLPLISLSSPAHLPLISLSSPSHLPLISLSSPSYLPLISPFSPPYLPLFSPLSPSYLSPLSKKKKKRRTINMWCRQEPLGTVQRATCAMAMALITMVVVLVMATNISLQVASRLLLLYLISREWRMEEWEWGNGRWYIHYCRTC